MHRGQSRDRSWAVHAISTLNPGYMAFVMASGIVAVGLSGVGVAALSGAVGLVCLVGYAVLLVLYAIRVVAFRSEVAADLRRADTSFGFFTLVAGTNVAGVVAGSLFGWWSLAVGLWLLGLIAFAVLGYAIPVASLLRPSVNPQIGQANGTWFLWTVAAQSVAILSIIVADHVGAASSAVVILAAVAWSVGVGLYGIELVSVFWRLTSRSFTPQNLTEPYWIAMGATAISVLAASKIIGAAEGVLDGGIVTVMRGAEFILWAWGSWLIPLLLLAGVWRLAQNRGRFFYAATVWGMVFPMGMYAVASASLSTVDRLPVADIIGRVWVAVAAVVWLVCFIAMVAHNIREAKDRRSTSYPTTV